MFGLYCIVLYYQMSNINPTYFISLYKYIKQSNIYSPNQDVWCYYNIIGYEQPDIELGQNYEKFIQNYTTKNNTLKLDWNWIFYYVYVILSYDNKLETKLYNKIIMQIIDGEFVVFDKVNAIKQIMVECGKTPDIINGWMEGDILCLIDEIIELDLDMEEEFYKIVSDIKKSTLKSYCDIIPYLIKKMDNIKNEIRYKKYFDILRGKKLTQINIGNFILEVEYYYYPDEILLKIDINTDKYSCLIVSEDVHYLEELSNYFSFLQKGGLTTEEFKIILNKDSIILELQDIYRFEILLNKNISSL